MRTRKLALAGCIASVALAFEPAIAPRNLALPIAQMKRSDMLNTFNQARDGHKHEATDILAPRNTPVLAVDDGTIVKLFWSRAGGRTIYQFDPSERFCYYYAHLDGYAADLAEKDHVRKGQVIGYVGTTGNAAPDSPHLHFGITVIGPEKKWWGGTAIDPYPLLSAAFERQAR